MTELPESWTPVRVGDISKSIQYGYTASASDAPTGAKMLRITDIQNGVVNWGTVPFCKIDELNRLKFSLEPGDIVFARTGGTVGKSFLIRHVPEPAVFASYLIRVSVSPTIEPDYLYWFFQSLSYWEQIGLKKGGLQGNVNASTLATISLNLPPLPEQRRIVAKIEALFSELDAGQDSLTRAQAQLRLYRQSLLKAAFQGRLTVDWRAANPDKLESPETLLSRIRSERDARYKQALDDWQQALAEWRAGGEMGRKPAKPSRPDWPQQFDFGDLTPLPFGWVYLPFEGIAYTIRNGISKRPDEAGTLKIFRISAVRPMVFDLSDFRYLVADDEFDDFRLQQGDLVFTRYNGSRAFVGVAAVYRGDGSHVYPDKLIRCDVC